MFLRFFLKKILLPLGNLSFKLGFHSSSAPSFKGPRDTNTDVNSSHIPMWLCTPTKAYTLTLLWLPEKTLSLFETAIRCLFPLLVTKG